MAEELIPIKDIETEQMKIGDVYELHFNIKNVFQVIAGWLAPTWSEQQKTDKINLLIQKTIDASTQQKWFRVLNYKVIGNDLIMRIGISNLPAEKTISLGVIPLVVALVAGIIISIGLVIGINVAISKVFKVIDKTSPYIIAGLIGLGLFSIWIGRPLGRSRG